MKSIIVVGLMLSLTQLTGCASDPTWNKAGVAPYDTNNQLAKCRYDVGMAKITKEERNSLISDCMRANGFRYN